MAGIHMRGRGMSRGRGNHHLEMLESQHGQFPNSTYIKSIPDKGCFKLYVKSIPRSYTKTTLLNIFKKVSSRATVPYFHPAPPGVPITWAFVEYPTFNEANRAIQSLNNNVILDNIEISFAKEKPPPEYFDYNSEDELCFLNHCNPMPAVPIIDPRTLKMTVRNDQALGITCVRDNYKIRPIRPENLKRLEENLFQKILKMHKENALSGKCVVCEASTALACSMTCLTFYCSEDCQARHWPHHSESCKTCNENGSESDDRTDLRAGGDTTPYVNGHSLVQSEREKNNKKFGDKTRFDDRFAFKKPSSNGSDSSGRIDKGRINTDQGRAKNSECQNNSNFGQRFSSDQSRGRNNNRQNESTSGQRNMFEERKSRLSNQNQARSDNSAQSTKNNVSSQQQPDWHVPTQALRRQAAPKKPEEKPTTSSDFLFKEQEFLSHLEEPKTIPVAPSSAVGGAVSFTSFLNKGVVEEVDIVVKEPNRIFYVQLFKNASKCSVIHQSLNPSGGATYPPCSPVLHSICLASFEDMWSRCQVTSLEPLAIIYIDFGNSETVSADRLFKIPPELVAAPPFAVKVKLADGTPIEHVNKEIGERLFIKPIEKTAELWVVQINGVEYSEAAAQPAPLAVQDPDDLSNFLSEGVVEEVKIGCNESDGVYYVLLTRTLPEINSVCTQLDTANNTPFVPVLGAICSASYEYTWSRCRVICLEPLTVYYIDFGYSETLTADRLFTIPPDLASIPPFAVKIKLATGTPTEYFNKNEGDSMSIKPIKKAGDHWVVQIADNELKTVSAAASVTQSTDSSPVSTVVSAPALLPADVFTEVFLQHRSVMSLVVTPVACRSQLTKMMESIQRFQPLSSPAITNLKPGLKCLVKSPIDENWYRGKVMKLDPLAVRFVDYGNIEVVKPVDIRELPESFATEPQFVVYVKTKEGVPTCFSKGDIFAVKPLYKENAAWIVEVAPDASTEQTKLAEPLESVSASPSQADGSATSNGTNTLKQQVSTAIPEMFKADCYSTVVITHPLAADSYCVGEPTIWSALTEMNQYFLASDCSSTTLTPTLGALGLALFEDQWYRVKVVCMEPLSVKYIDFGNIEPISPNDLKKCPDTHKDVPPLIHQITLAPGTPKKFYHLPAGSELSIKAISMISDENVLIQIEGQSDDTEITSVTKHDVSECGSSSSTQTTNQVTLPQAADSLEQQTHAEDGIAELQYTVDMLQEGWTAKFMFTHLGSSSGTLHGYLYSDMIPSTIDFMVNFDKVMETEAHDPANQVPEGCVVGCKQDDSWYRIQLSSEQLSVFVDMGSVDKCPGNYFTLPDRFSTAAVPVMAAKITIDNDDKQLLTELMDNPEVTLSVVEVSEQEVKVTLQESGVCVQLKRWRYDPLTVPDPLGPSTLVTICRVMQSNTFLVRPAHDIKALQIIQIECRKNAGNKLQNPPKVGNHVAYFLKEDDMFCRSRIVKVSADKDEYELFNIDLGTKVSAKLAELKPLSDTLLKLSCRVTQVELKDVILTEITPEAKVYICSLVENEKFLRIEFERTWNTATLTLDESGENVNSTLSRLLTPVIKPDNFGKYLLNSIQESNPPRNQELEVIVTQSEPLYVQLLDHNASIEQLHIQIQEHCAKDNDHYKPCSHEVCFVNYDKEWYRSVCLMETPTGVSPHQLLDFGNITEVSSDHVRRIHPDMMKMPIAGIACKINGLPSYQDCSQELQARLDDLLDVYSHHTVTFETEPTPDNTHFVINIPKLLATLKNEGLF